MKAVQIHAYGGSEVLEVNKNVPQPIVKEGQLLIEVKAASINPFDIALVSGIYKERMPLSFPVTVGGDFSGVIAETGQEIFGTAHVANGGSGSFAEFASVNTTNLSPKPKSISFEEAAALPLVGSSAVQALEEHIKLSKNQKILIHGGAGGIGHLAIQLAKYVEAFVATTVRTNDIDFVKSLGADEIIDFTNEDFSTKLHDFDAVFDTVGGEVLQKSDKVIHSGGIVVSMKEQPARGIAQATKTNTEHLTRVAELVDSGIIHVNIDKIFPLEQVREAWKYKEEGHPQGKVVISI